MEEQKPPYSMEFKQKAVALAKKNGNASEIARELGISARLISSWIKSLKKLEANRYEKRKIKSLEYEITYLKRNIQNLIVERDTLGKVLGTITKGKEYRT